MQAGVLSPPAVSIDGKVMCTGKVPSKSEVETWLKNIVATAETTANPRSVSTPASPFGKPVSPFAVPESNCACGGNCICIDN